MERRSGDADLSVNSEGDHGWNADVSVICREIYFWIADVFVKTGKSMSGVQSRP